MFLPRCRCGRPCVKRCHARSAKAGGFADRFDWGWRICGGAFQTVYLRRAQAAVNAGGKLRANDAGYKIMAVAVGPLTGTQLGSGRDGLSRAGAGEKNNRRESKAAHARALLWPEYAWRRQREASSAEPKTPAARPIPHLTSSPPSSYKPPRISGGSPRALARLGSAGTDTDSSGAFP